jgi:hypothetical protein
MPKILKATIEKKYLTLTGNKRDLRKNIQKIPTPLEIPLNPLSDDILFAKNKDRMQNLRLIM